MPSDPNEHFQDMSEIVECSLPHQNDFMRSDSKPHLIMDNWLLEKENTNQNFLKGPNNFGGKNA